MTVGHQVQGGVVVWSRFWLWCSYAEQGNRAAGQGIKIRKNHRPYAREPGGGGVKATGLASQKDGSLAAGDLHSYI